MLNKNEIENIKEKFKEVVKYSQNIPEPKVDELFDRWLEGKRNFIEAMGGNLIFEYPEKVSFDLSPSDKAVKIESFEDMLERNYDNIELSRFIDSQREGFFSNKVVNNYTLDNGESIPKGMKLLKAFKYFEKDKELLETLQQAASMIIQENKVEGRLCISVHPLDYLSSSENDHNWRSCHSLDGEYRSGNLSYMEDSSTVICYLKSDEDRKLPNFPENIKWNSKKWRMLLFFSEDWDMLFAGRQYPFPLKGCLDFINQILPQVNLGEWSNWTDKKISDYDNKVKGAHFHFYSPYIPYSDKLYQLNEIITNEKNSLHFNDLLYSSCYSCYYCYRTYKPMWYNSIWGDDKPEEEKPVFIKYNSDKPHIKIGGNVKCLCCGQKDIELTESMMCNDCEIEYGECDSDVFATCPCCGRRFIFDEGTWVDDAEVVCPDCANDETDICLNCGSIFYKSSLHYDRETKGFYCEDCYTDLKCERGEII